MADNEILQMHDLKPAPGAKKDRTRVGRGEGSKGKTSGRGAKGQTKRNHVRPGFEGGQLPLYMRLPKLRGFKNPFKVEFQVINIARLVELFPEGGEVAVADLIAKGAVRDNAPVKVLGDGETTVAFTLKGVKASASAKSRSRPPAVPFRGLISPTGSAIGCTTPPANRWTGVPFSKKLLF